MEELLGISPMSISPFKGKIPRALEEIVLEYRLKARYADQKCLILESPIPNRYLKYVVDPGTHEPLDKWLQSVVLRGLRNQYVVSDMPGVQKVFSAEFYQQIPGLFELEFVGGTPLSAYTESDSALRLTPEEIEFVGLSTYGTVSTINDRGIAHRDVKPGNIVLLTPYMATKLIDWSLAADVQEHRAEVESGRVLGTPTHYLMTNDLFGVRDRYGLGLTLLQAAASTDERRAFDKAFEETNPISLNGKTREWIDHTLKRVQNNIPGGLYELMDALLHPEQHEEVVFFDYQRFAKGYTGLAAIQDKVATRYALPPGHEKRKNLREIVGVA